LLHHPAIALDDAKDGAGGSGVIVSVPAEIESRFQAFDEVSFAVK